MRRRFFILLIVVYVMGCATVSDIREARELPGIGSEIVSRESVYYDTSIRAYRQKRSDSSSVEGRVVRDAMGKKKPWGQF